MRTIFSTITFTIIPVAFALFVTGGPLRAADEGDFDLSARECENLYNHQLKVASVDNGFPLQPAINSTKDRLEKEDVRSKQLNRCRQMVNRRNFECQMKAASMLEILQCSLRYGAAYRVSPPPVISDEKEDLPYAPSEKQEESSSGDLSVGNVSVVRYNVNPENCNRVYNHLVSVYKKLPQLKDDDRTAKMVRYWQSGEARDSFSKKCLSVYKPSDLGCILSTSNPDVIQACLVQIPE